MTGRVAGTDWLRQVNRKIDIGAELVVSAEVAAGVEVEAWLQKHNIEYAPPIAIPMSYIDEKRSRANQARKDPLVADSVERYTTAFKAGAKFPPIVGYLIAGKFVIIDGNNRQAAARKAGLDEIVGIVISAETPSELIQLLTIEANAHHGVTPDLSWRLQQAFYLCGVGFSDVDAAEAAAVTLQQLRNARILKEADQRARSLKVHGFADLPATSRQNLNALKDNPVFYQAAMVATTTAMTIDETRDMVRAVKAERSEGARIALIGTIAQERDIEARTAKAVGKSKNQVSSPKQALVAGIGMILKCNPADLVRQIVTTTDRDIVNKRLSLLETKVLELMVAMDQLKNLDEAVEP